MAWPMPHVLAMALVLSIQLAPATDVMGRRLNECCGQSPPTHTHPTPGVTANNVVLMKGLPELPKTYRPWPFGAPYLDNATVADGPMVDYARITSGLSPGDMAVYFTPGSDHDGSVVRARRRAALKTTNDQDSVPPMVDIFAHGDGGFPCWRVPAVVLATSTGRLFAFAEARNYSGDGCEPAGLKPNASHPNEGPRSLALRTSTDSGRSWGAIRIVDWNGINPAAVYDEHTDKVIVHYPSAYWSGGTGHPIIGGSDTKQLICSSDGLCGAPTPTMLYWPGCSPITDPRCRIRVGAGPGLGVQLTHGPHAGRLLFAGHAGQIDVVWYSDDHAKTWILSKSTYGSNNKSKGVPFGQYGCGRHQGCFDEPFPLQLPDGKVQLNMRNDSLTCDPKNCCCAALAITHPRSVADSTDGGLTFGPMYQQHDLPEPTGGCQASSIVVGDTVLFSNPSSGSSNRSLLTLRRSQDSGETYPPHIATLVWPGAGGYSCLTRLANSTATVGLVFERSAPGCKGGSCRISFVSLPVLKTDDGNRNISASTPDSSSARLLRTDDHMGSAVIASIEAPGVRLKVFADCSATAINTATNISSLPGPLLLLFNRVSDNRPQDWNVCVSATALDNQTLRVVADHSYGYVDIRVTAGVRWLRFELLSLERWNADPKQKHLKFNSLCPRDLCGVYSGDDPSDPWPGGNPGSGFPYRHAGGSPNAPGSRSEVGTFIGTVGGAPVKYASGFLTITSNWQFGADMWFAQQGWRLVYLIAPEAEVPQLIDEVNAAEAIAKRSANRALSWLWHQGLATSENLNDTIKLANALGVQVILFSDLNGPGVNGYITNVGDYTVNKKAWPSGLGEIRDRLAPHGLKVGFHMLSSGSSVCMDQMQGPSEGPWSSFPERFGSCWGNIMMDTVVSRERPELFIPQGIGPLHYMYAITAGSWPCHEKAGKGCGDTTRRPWPAGPGLPGVIPLTAAERTQTCEVRTPACLPSNPLMLVNTSTGAASWSKLGRYRDGGAIAFSGGGSHGRLKHTPEYDFRNNSFFYNLTCEFTLHMTIHPVGPTVGRVQVLASKAGEWSLQLSAAGTLQWRVHLASGWVQAGSTRLVKNGTSVVIKATHAGNLGTGQGTLKIFSCVLAPDSYACPLSVAEGSASGLLPLQVGMADIIWGGAEMQAVEAVAPATSFVGAMEEMFLSRISLENITAHLFLANAYPMYLFDYTQPVARKYWADSVAAIYNEAGAVCGQWDGSEFASGIAGWGLPHSSQTWSAGADSLWWTSFAVAAEESKKQWQEDIAVELSITLDGDGPWHGDMEPFGDEDLIKGGRCVAAAGSWLIGMVSSMYANSLALNAYDAGIDVFFKDTSVDTAEAQVDCWFGGLIALGIGPEMTTSSEAAFKPPLSTILPRINFWNGLFAKYGHSMGRDTVGGGIAALGGVDTCTIYGCGTSFLLELSGGTQPGARGLYISNTSHLDLSHGKPTPLPLAANTTLLMYLTPGLPFANLSLACLGETVTFVVCANASVFMGGDFWNLANQNVEETVLGSLGETLSKRQLFPGPQTGAIHHSFHQHAGDTVIYTKSKRGRWSDSQSRLKLDDDIEARAAVRRW